MLRGILVPMPEEIELIIENMEVHSVYESGRRKFYNGVLNGKKCVVALSRIGKVASSVTAAVMIERFKIDQLIVAGVAGAVASHLKLGDIVVATESIQHDLDARPLFPQFEAPLLDKAFFSCNEILVSKALEACKEFLKDDFKDYILAEDIQQFSLNNPSIYCGQIGCGDQFIGSSEQLSKISRQLPEVLCVEMEGGAVGQICYEYNIPYVIVRTISDSANDRAPIDFNRYIQRVAKYYTYGITRKIINSI
ncbi:MAG TPA: 5'-methylthioadenosine/adenosylhomocysteine nucleosidase [Cytophagaceae bacterium]